MRIHRKKNYNSKWNLPVAVGLIGCIALVCLFREQEETMANASYDMIHRMASEDINLHNDVSKLSSTSFDSDDNYKLAREQSFGFFNDISNENWIRAQNIHAQMFPNYYENLELNSNRGGDRGKAEKLKDTNKWHAENFQEEFHCPLAQRLPATGQADGPKWVCDPHRIAKQDSCLVYSFGSNGKAEFEEAIIKNIGSHCEIHTFDPTGYNRRNGDFAEALKGYATFHQWGLATPRDLRQPDRFKTLDQTMKELGHIGRTIDIFKIDCEWCEWFTFEQWLKHDIRQILVEAHNAPMPEAQKFFFDLHDAGYVIFSKEANYDGGGSGAEFGFVKLSKDFFTNATLYNQKEVS